MGECHRVIVTCAEFRAEIENRGISVEKFWRELALRTGNTTETQRANVERAVRRWVSPANADKTFSPRNPKYRAGVEDMLGLTLEAPASAGPLARLEKRVDAAEARLDALEGTPPKRRGDQRGSGA